MTTGLDAIGFAIPTHYLAMQDLARARGIDPDKYLIGLGQHEMAVATPCEDTVALAASAGLRTLEAFDVDPDSIGLLIVGTETGIDHSKPVSSHVHEILSLPSNCRVFETKHACYGATAGVSMASNWVNSPRARGRKALVIASDIARYGIKTAGEPTQGAGAVAMVISQSPSLVSFDMAAEGTYSKQVMDFWRPLYSKEAITDGHYSIQCYLDALAGAYGDYWDQLGAGGAAFSDRYAACLYHVPFVKMAQKAHQRLLECDAGIGFEKGSAEASRALADYRRRTAPYLKLNAQVGNIYTGSMFLALLNLLADDATRLAGEEIALFSYGSGCSAEFMGARVCEGAGRFAGSLDYAPSLNERVAIAIDTYETILEAAGHADLNDALVCDPERWQSRLPVQYAGTHDHRRQYLRVADGTTSGSPVTATVLSSTP